MYAAEHSKDTTHGQSSRQTEVPWPIRIPETAAARLSKLGVQGMPYDNDGYQQHGEQDSLGESAKVVQKIAVFLQNARQEGQSILLEPTGSGKHTHYENQSCYKC